MIDYDYYYDQYRYTPKKSITPQKELIDYSSAISVSTYVWSGATKRPATTCYIDGSSLSGLNERPYSISGIFPKGKGRRKPSTPSEKKINTGDAFISLVPAEKPTLDNLTVRSEKTRSPLSMTTSTHYSTFPDVQRKSADIRSNRIYSATVFDDENSETKFYGRCATTHASGAWVRRYKSINESQTITDLLRDPASKDKNLLKKRPCYKLLLSSSSTSSFGSSLIKRKRAKC